jgi:hypothetical protein
MFCCLQARDLCPGSLLQLLCQLQQFLFLPSDCAQGGIFCRT